MKLATAVALLALAAIFVCGISIYNYMVLGWWFQAIVLIGCAIILGIIGVQYHLDRYRD